jgi:hypothetical protein
MGQNYQWILPVAIVLISLITKIASAMKDQAEKRERQKRREQAELDALRTGGQVSQTETAPVPPQFQNQQSARATLEEMAAKRRAQIEELRRRRAAAAGATTVPPPAPPMSARQAEPARRPAQAPLPSGAGETARRVRAQAEKEQQTEQNRERAARVDAANRQREAAEKVKTAQESKRRNERREVANREAESKTRAASQAIEQRAAAIRGTPDPEPVRSRAATPVRKGGRHEFLLNPAEVRRAIVLQELLGPPLSLRQ